MVEKVFISPNRVRAYGNIVNMKTGDDFTLVNSELTVTTDTVDGAEMTVFQFGVEGGISIALTSSASTCNVGDNVLLTATVMDRSTPVEAAEVTFKVGETVLGTDETDANGVATYTYATSSAGSLSFSASYQTSTSNSVSVTVNHSYSLSFSQATYTASGGSATLECTLLEDNVAKTGASIAVTGTDSSTYTATTDNSGVASVTVTGINANTTFTATYQGATATCTVTVQTYLFYDACDSASGLSNYGSAISLGSSSTATLSYDSTMNAYKLTSNSSDVKFVPITALDGLTEFKLTMEWYQPSASNYSSTAVEPVVGTTTKAGLCYTFFNDAAGFVRQRYSGGRWRSNDTLVSGIAYRDEWLKIELTIEDTSVTMKAYRMNSDTPFATESYTLTNISSDYSTASNRRYGLGIGYANNSYGYYRNIKAEEL